MLKFIRLSFIAILSLIYVIILPLFNYVYAIDICESIGIKPIFSINPIPENISELKVTLTNLTNNKYRLRFARSFPYIGPKELPWTHIYVPEAGEQSSGGKVTITIKNTEGELARGFRRATLEIFNINSTAWEDHCKDITYYVGYQFDNCFLSTPNNITESDQVIVNPFRSPAGTWKVMLKPPGVTSIVKEVGQVTIDNNGTGSTIIGPLPTMVGVKLFLREGNGRDFCLTSEFTITAGGQSSTMGKPGLAAPLGAAPGAAARCPASTPAAGGCICNIRLGTIDYPGISTAVGCVPIQPVGLIKAFLALVLGFGGGLSFLLMIIGAFQMMTSAGNPDTLKQGYERFNSAIIGILFLLFSILLLQIIGFGILNIPGFS